MVYPLLALLMMGGAVGVVGASTCPAPGDVTDALERLVAPEGGPNREISPRDQQMTAEIRRPAAETAAGAGGPATPLSITLRAQSGAVLAERVLAESGSCAELAEAAAIVIAAWERGLRPDLGPDLPQAPRGTIARSPAPSPVAVSGRPEWPIEVGIAALAAAAARDVSPGLQVDATVGTFGWGVAPRIVGSIEAPHERALGPAPGMTLWSRSTLGVGARKRIVVGAFALDGQAHTKVGFIRARGSGFEENYTRSGWDIGAGLGLQLVWPRRWIAPFLGLGATIWAGPKSAELVGSDGADPLARTSLPRLDLSLALGVSVGRFR